MVPHNKVGWAKCDFLCLGLLSFAIFVFVVIWNWSASDADLSKVYKITGQVEKVECKNGRSFSFIVISLTEQNIEYYVPVGIDNKCVQEKVLNIVGSSAEIGVLKSEVVSLTVGGRILLGEKEGVNRLDQSLVGVKLGLYLLILLLVVFALTRNYRKENSSKNENRTRWK